MSPERSLSARRTSDTSNWAVSPQLAPECVLGSLVRVPQVEPGDLVTHERKFDGLIGVESLASRSAFARWTLTSLSPSDFTLLSSTERVPPDNSNSFP